MLKFYMEGEKKNGDKIEVLLEKFANDWESNSQKYLQDFDNQLTESLIFLDEDVFREKLDRFTEELEKKTEGMDADEIIETHKFDLDIIGELQYWVENVPNFIKGFCRLISDIISEKRLQPAMKKIKTN